MGALANRNRGETTAERPSVMELIGEHQLVQLLAPIVGAAGGVVAATVAVERFGVKREVATLGGATAAVMAAQQANGVLKAVLEGAAAAGIALALADMLQLARPKLIFGDRPAPEPQRQTAPPDAITRGDLEKALQRLQSEHEAQRRELEATVHQLLDRLRTANAEIERLRGGGDRRDASAGEPNVLDEGELVSSRLADGVPTEITEAELDPASLDHLRSIYSQLDDSERRQLSSMIATLPKDALERAQQQLFAMSPDEAVAYLRAAVFSTARPVA